ncbi:SDR family NAD(P)-dependent oxidoreductase [Achromobacter piechaudii]|uniref:3-phenylpropionate-dihydrodiol/cinnamic acid-dihydrodiol dehydrogenase n=2 Tax=Achromobacter piechaudii TaxID=72556 RepID=A0A6S7BYV2_9BURK|nr:SDR family NAD(P)-dependent oxidoreductase [Achromobacter piechaudii]EFF73516.1 oxidoreductase, short chain dehydrogenase/reductase family protein [Achromobacter piechaudii ATCC 43553]KNY09527.1 short-chain dehydrogenase [Achromobacter piechaudii]CAB3733054.1 3-phenylpropionate-dihydrodiol/cinnamic acid-dihydrodiol dehydrogenase [Achromobacter piechaudii]CAB3823597.1 3-phenylpropionate-dihydrodiol/cinnamic acid-dihydrodiol dehydrogenase [Achromobacter piechaudii]CAB3912553.1 3-phenylpropion
MNAEKIWLVTGASTGLGLTLVKMLLDQGHKVAATSRDGDALLEAVGAKLEGQFLPLTVDLVDERNVRRAVDATVAAFGGVDVVVNNARAACPGSLAELSDAQVRASFDINVFGTLNVIRAVLPRMRAQGSGHVINVSSILGFDGRHAEWGAYSAAKFAVCGLTEALAAQAAPWGVRVSLVYPGALREHSPRDGGDSPERAAHLAHSAHGQGGSDVAKAAQALIQAAQAQYAPLHLFLGRDAFDQARVKIQSVQQELARWREMSVSIGFVDERRLAA